MPGFRIVCQRCAVIDVHGVISLCSYKVVSFPRIARAIDTTPEISTRSIRVGVPRPLKLIPVSQDNNFHMCAQRLLLLCLFAVNAGRI
ncbi:hypothetical protein, partial [Sansalvadorimonas verongulae]|uniref:hypothetical protein n=1 Tax=Sansalvadorimonas verongulae TaxID=2172824 RepID=UPI001E45E150